MAEEPGDLGWAVDGPPTGLWVTATGTADALMRDTLSLHPDGSGYLSSSSVLRGEETFPLSWRHERPGVLMIATTWPDDEPSDAPEWETVRYVAACASNDVTSSTPVLRNADDNVFWSLCGPITLRSRNVG